MTVSGDVSCALPIITGGSLRVDGTFVSQPTDGQGAPVYLLQVDNPDGAADITIGGRSWPTARHGGEGVLYAWTGTDPDDPEGAVTVSVGGTETRYALADGVFQPLYDVALTAVSEPLPVAEDYIYRAEYYDPGTNSFPKVDTVLVSELYPRTELKGDSAAKGWYSLASATVDHLYIEGDVNLIVGAGTNFVVNQNIYMSSGSHLTIWGTTPVYDMCGMLTVSNSGLGNNVTINGGRITAIGCGGVAGINGTVTINGGLVNATGGYDAAGIGGGNINTSVTITGGTVIAKGGERAAGIGGGNESRPSVTTTVNITGGTVTATGGTGGAGIGSGSASSSSTTVTITGGTVTATGGSGGAGIGTGRVPYGSTSVTIDGGAVTAIAGGDSAAIGTGSGGSNPANVTIRGGTVTANGGAGIGNGGSLIITGGSVKGTCSTQPKDESGKDLYLLKVSNSSGVSVNINGKDWSPLNHTALDSSDGTLYAWVPGETAKVRLNNGEAVDYLFINNDFVKSFEYDWDKARWEWTDDYSAATLVVPNKYFAFFNSLRWTVPASLTKSTEPGCETAGVREYTVSVTVNGEPYKDTRTVTLDPLGHDWDYDHGKLRPLLMGKIMVYCKNDRSHHQLFSVSGTRYGEVDPKPDCGTGTAGRQPVYRQFTVDGKTYEVRDTDRFIYTTHTWGDWYLADDGVLRRECENCHTEEKSDHKHNWKLPDPIHEPGMVHWDSVWGKDEGTGTEGYLPAEGYLTLDVYCEDAGCEYHSDPMKLLVSDINRAIVVSPGCEETEKGKRHEYADVTLGSDTRRYERELEIPAVGHDWGHVVFSYNRDPAQEYLSQDELENPGEHCWLAIGCSRCGKASEKLVPAQSVSAVVNAPATCEIMGSVRLVFTAVYDGKVYRNDAKDENGVFIYNQYYRLIPATGHNYDRAQVSWSADHSSAVVTFICGNDPDHTQKVTVTPTAVVTAATCEEPGRIIWTADASRKADELGYAGTAVFTETEILPATGHIWDVEGDTYPLDAGVTGDRTTLTIHCKNDPAHTQTVPTVLERVDAECTQATCRTEGREVFQMTFQFNGETHTLEPETITIPECPHKWSDWELVSTDPSGATYKRRCENDGCDAEETSNTPYTYTFGEAEWTFKKETGDALSVQVTVTCNETGKTETLTYSGDQIKEVPGSRKEPTCTTAGQVQYTVTASVGSASKDYTGTAPIPATGHIWDVEEASVWSDDHSTVTIKFKCIDCDAVQEKMVRSTRTTLVPAGCDTEGQVLYSAEVEFEGTDYYEAKSVNTKPLGHDWDVEGEDIPLRCGVQGDFTTVTYSCRRDESHTRTVYAVLELVRSDKPTCTAEGKDVYQMTYTVGTQKYTIGGEVEYVVPALGHLWGSDGTCTRCGEKDPSRSGSAWELPPASGTAPRVRWTQPAAGVRPYLTVMAYRMNGEGEVMETQQIRVAGEDILVSGTTEADCETPGTTTYSARVELDDKTVTYTTVLEDIPPLGHLWRQPLAVWSDDYTTVKFTFYCDRKGEHEKILDAQVKRESIRAATCTEPGEDHLYASVELDGVGGFSSKLVDTAALGHTYVDGACVRCGAKDPNYKAPAGSGRGAAGAPDTGDGQEPLLWAVLLAGCAGALAVLVTGRRKARRR